MLVLFLRHVSQLLKDFIFNAEENGCIYYNLQTFLEPTHVSLRYDKIKKFDIILGLGFLQTWR